MEATSWLYWSQVGVLLATTGVLAWRLLPRPQACLAVMVCVGTLWLVLHPAVADRVLDAAIPRVLTAVKAVDHIAVVPRSSPL